MDLTPVPTILMIPCVHLCQLYRRACCDQDPVLTTTGRTDPMHPTPIHYGVAAALVALLSLLAAVLH